MILHLKMRACIDKCLMSVASCYAAGIQIPDGMFLTYMAGQYNKQAEEKFDSTKGGCIQYVELAAGNHYAITDWNPDTAPHQVTMHMVTSHMMTKHMVTKYVVLVYHSRTHSACACIVLVHVTCMQP